MQPSPKTNTPSSRPKEAKQTVVWWVLWILLTIASFFAAAMFWTPVIAKHYGSIHQTKASILWVISVFGSWLVILIPLMIVMYQKVDKAYEDARLRREKAQNRFKSIAVERKRRLLAPELSRQLERAAEIIPGAHLVTLTLESGKRIPNVFIENRKEILGIYDAEGMNFEVHNIIALEAQDSTALPSFSTVKWLRLDGVVPSE